MKLALLLKEKGFTQIEIARVINVSQALISKWVHGICEPQMENVVKLAEVLNCSVEEIVNCFKEPQKNFSARM